MEAATSRTVKRSITGIRKAFTDVDVLALPNPGKGVTRKSEQDQVTFKGEFFNTFGGSHKKVIRIGLK